MSIIDELMALREPDRLIVCLEVYDAARTIKDPKKRAEAMEMLFLAMAQTVQSQLVERSKNINVKPSYGTKGKTRVRGPAANTYGTSRLKSEEPRNKSTRLKHQPFADALKKGSKS